MSIKPARGSMYITEGERLLLECVADGDPAPSLYWDVKTPSGRQGDYPTKVINSEWANALVSVGLLKWNQTGLTKAIDLYFLVQSVCHR